MTGSFTVDGKEAGSVQEAIDQTVDLAKNAKKSEWKPRVTGKETTVRDGDVIAVDEGKNISIAPDAKTGVYKVGVVDNPEFASVKAGNVLIGRNGIDMGGTRITGLADGRVYRGSSDAVTGGQLWDAYRRMDKIDERAKMIGAHAAALSALHPVPYNPYEPTSAPASARTAANIPQPSECSTTSAKTCSSTPASRSTPTATSWRARESASRSDAADSAGPRLCAI